MQNDKNDNSNPNSSDSYSKFEEAQKNYSQTEKFKEAQRRYRESEKGKVAQSRYLQSDKGKQVLLRYRKSEKAKQASEARKAMKKLLDQCLEWLEQNPEKTSEDFYRTLIINDDPRD